MATMCENCYEVDGRKYKARRTCKHCGGLLVQIDEMLLTTISVLNKKGYHTKFCCSGHVYDTFPQTYIYFTGDVKLPDIPEGFRYEDGYYGGGFCIRKDVEDDWTPRYSHMEILQRNLKLIEWATELPHLNESNIL